MNEEQTRFDLIDMALRQAGWATAPARVAPEQYAPGRVQSGGRQKALRADYVLMYGKRRIAVVEAKAAYRTYDQGETQARYYASALGVRFAYSTNGHKVLRIDMLTQETATFEIEAFPTPVELLAMLEKSEADDPALVKACQQVPWAVAGEKRMRYYQERAVKAAIAALGKGAKRILLTLATGTGKTFIAFQFVHKLISVKWSLAGMGKRPPRVLFLTDRNNLAGQAMESFTLAEGCYRLKPNDTKPPLYHSVYFTLYQTLLGEADAGENGSEGGVPQMRYTAFPKEFFDLVIVDECHRGGANDESQWRTVLDYFKDAVHVGLTATPKCNVNGSTYEYFGQPVYEYKLKQGIIDGFLTPYRVKRFTTTWDTYELMQGDTGENLELLEEEHPYVTDEIQRKQIRIQERDREFVRLLFQSMPLDQKALVFCVTQWHAQQIARVIREEAAKLGHTDPDYCMRVTSDDGEIGESALRVFRKNDNTIPTILVSSEKLTTGVDACNVRSIVLYRNVNSMVEFKQIMGRGTRLCEGKAYFTIYDFVGATTKFKDPRWDGDVVCDVCGENPCVCERGKPGPRGTGGGGQGPQTPCQICGCLPCTCPSPEPQEIIVRLGPKHEAFKVTSFEEEVLLDSELVSVQVFFERFFKAIQALKLSAKELVEQWADEDQRTHILEVLKQQSFGTDELKKGQSFLELQRSDILDVLLYVAYVEKPLLREMRAQFATPYVETLPHEQQKVARIVLAQYENDGVWTIQRIGFSELLKQHYGSLGEAVVNLQIGNIQDLVGWYLALQKRLYINPAS